MWTTRRRQSPPALLQSRRRRTRGAAVLGDDPGTIRARLQRLTGAERDEKTVARQAHDSKVDVVRHRDGAHAVGGSVVSTACMTLCQAKSLNRPGERLAQDLQDVAPALREFVQTIRSGVRVTPCPASTPVRRGSGRPARTRTASCPRGAERLGSIGRLSASLPGRTRVSAGPGQDHQPPRVRRLPSCTCGS
jgi:hypothetical protein